MNIVYVSKISGKKSAGLSYSIPAQIGSQSKFDNVFWYNINNISKDNIINGQSCYNLDDFPLLRISKLPSPFNIPDLVIFEGVYIFQYIKIAKECIYNNIPYIIIPRSSLTKFAQNKKKMKKSISNWLFFKRFIKNARVIQYLTTKEFEDSGKKWNDSYIIIPNGIEAKDTVKQFKSRRELKGVFIGRADSYQKGIDLLLDACMQLKEELKSNKCKIAIYAPSTNTEKDDIQEMINNRELGDIIFKHDGVYGVEKEVTLLNSDFFILTSRFEGHPMGLIEALSYGLPCLVTDGTNMSDEINESDAGWTADNSVESIVKAFIRLLNEREYMPEKGQNALNLSKGYNWYSLGKHASEKYRSLLK